MALALSIRDARPEDAEEIVVLGKSVNVSTFGRFVGREGVVYLEGRYSVEKMVVDIKDTTKDFIVAATTTTTSSSSSETQHEQKIIGFAILARGMTYPCLEHLEDIIELQRIYIYPEFHGKGVGKALMGELEGRARREGRRNIWLGCFEGNERARGVYEKAGFVRVGERWQILGERRYLDWVMSKRL